MAAPSEEDLRSALASVLLRDDDDDEGVVDGIDGDIVSYLAGMLHEGDGLDDAEEVSESIGPFLEGYGCEEDLIGSCVASVMACAKNNDDDDGPGGAIRVTAGDDAHHSGGGGGEVKLLKQGIVSMSSTLNDQSEAEIDANRYMWGQENRVAAMTNAQRDAHDSTVSSKDRRKARKELEATRREYEARVALLRQEEADGGG